MKHNLNLHGLFHAASVRRVVLMAICLVAPAAVHAQAQSAPEASDAVSTAKLAASVKAVFDDGTIVLKIGSSLVPVRLEGVTLLPGSVAAIRKGLPEGLRVVVQVVKKGPPAMVVVWRNSQKFQDGLVKQGLARVNAP